MFSASVWSLFPLITSGAVAVLPPLVYATMSTFAAAIFFALLLTVRKEWSGLRLKETYKDILILAFLNGAVYHGGVFIASRITAPGNTTLLLQMEIFFSMIILRLWGKESLVKNEVIGAVCMLLGATVIVWPQGGISTVHSGDLILIGCSMVPPIANVSARRARSKMSGSHVICLRSFAAGFMLLILAVFFEKHTAPVSLTKGFSLVLLNGVIIMGIGKLSWVEAIHRIPISVAVSLGATAPALTLLLTYLFFGTAPSVQQWSALILITAGILALTYRPGGSTREVSQPVLQVCGPPEEL